MDHKNAQTVLATFTLWQRFALGGVLLLSLWMNFYQLGQNGFGNLYYAAGVRSMLDSWHTFFFVSFDPAGFVSLDKPPLGFWLQVVSVRIFGFTPFSVYLPQAIAGVLAVAILYFLIQRHFGAIAALLAALALALSPISVVTNRNNTIDSTLALALLLGAWAIFKATETGKHRWLMLSALAVAIGFNIKTLEAYLVIPAFGLLYLLAAPKGPWQRIGQLAVAAVVLLAISLSWSLVVDLTPISQRPYVGSSQNNSEISLALGYNGISRLLGLFRSGGQPPNNTNIFPSSTPTNGNREFGQVQSPAANNPGGSVDTGAPGPFRLFNEPLGGQIAWLLPMALVGMLALVWQRRPHLQHDRRQQSLLLWGTWLLTMGIFFSIASFIHQYYLTEMAPALAALFGIGIVTMWHDYRHTTWRGWLLPLALLATALEQMHLLSSYPVWSQWLIPIVAIFCLLGTLALVILRATWYDNLNPIKLCLLVATLCITILSLLIAPTIWATIPVIYNVQAQLPTAGPIQPGSYGLNSGNSGIHVDTTLLHYLEVNQGKTTFLVATSTTTIADAIILATNKPVMALGGFLGSDPILTTTQLATLIKKGNVRFFLLNSFRSRPQPPPHILTTWVTQHCITVPINLWQSTNPPDSSFSPLEANQLYDCATHQNFLSNENLSVGLTLGNRSKWVCTRSSLPPRTNGADCNYEYIELIALAYSVSYPL